MDVQSRDVAVEEHLKVINDVLEYCGYNERVRMLEECTPSMFICIFESLFNAKLHDILRHPQTFEDHLHNCQSLLATLAQKVLKVDLSYISGESICNGDYQSIMLLIEIFYELMKIVIGRKKKEEGKQISEVEVRAGGKPATMPSTTTTTTTSDGNPLSPPYSSTPPPVPSTPPQPYPATSPRMPSPINNLHDSSSSTSSTLSSSKDGGSGAERGSGSSGVERTSGIERVRTTGRDASPRSPRTPFDPVNKEDRRARDEERRMREGDRRASVGETRGPSGGIENRDTNVMMIPDGVSSPSKKTVSPSKADRIERKGASVEKRGKPHPHITHHSPKKRAVDQERERDEIARVVDNIDREIRATEESRIGKSPAASPGKRVHFTPSLSKISSHNDSYDSEDKEAFKENIQFRGSDKEFYENLMETIPEHVPRYVWENPLRQWLKIRPSTSPDKTQRNALAREQEMSHRTSELVNSMIKDYEASKRRKEHLDRVRKRAGVHAEIRERREQLVRLKKMDDENEIERKSRLLKRQSNEELLYRNLFAQSLKIQKDRIIEERKDSRERRAEYEHKCAVKQQSIENYYMQQYDLLRSQMDEEARNQQIAEQAQKVALKKMEGELRKKMRDQLELLKEQLRNEEELSYFRLFDTEKLYDALTHQ